MPLVATAQAVPVFDDETALDAQLLELESARDHAIALRLALEQSHLPPVAEDDEEIGLTVAIQELARARDAAMVRRLRVAAHTAAADHDVARKSARASECLRAVVALDRQFAQQIEAAPHRDWARRGDLLEHSCAAAAGADFVAAAAEAAAAAASVEARVELDVDPVEAGGESKKRRRGSEGGVAPERRAEGGMAPPPPRPAERRAGKRVRGVDCTICLEEVEPCHSVCAQLPKDGSGGTSGCSGGSSGCSRSASEPRSADCGHYVCSNCMVRWVRESVQNRKSVVKCCAPGCRATVPTELCKKLLGGESAAYQQLIAVQAEAAIVNKIFCPNRDCSAPMEAPLKSDAGWPCAACPHCGQRMCARCMVAWHEGVSCEHFQRLPPHLRASEDVALLQVAKDKGLRQCPQCNHLVERQVGDCNFVRCRCECSFCYACGTPYASTEPTATNSHGTPGCGCSLFAELMPHADIAAVVCEAARPPPPPPARPRPPQDRLCHCGENAFAYACVNFLCLRCCQAVGVHCPRHGPRRGNPNRRR